MRRLDCPHCGKRGIYWLRKLSLGPARPTRCMECGKKVGVPYSVLWAVAPFVAAILASMFVPSLALKVLVWAGGAVVMNVTHLRWVPLERRW